MSYRSADMRCGAGKDRRQDNKSILVGQMVRYPHFVKRMLAKSFFNVGRHRWSGERWIQLNAKAHDASLEPTVGYL